jgi:rubrerythrin
VSSDPGGSTEQPDSAERPDDGMQRWGGGMAWRADPEDRAGDPVCWLPRVCQACGALADEDPPTTCPRCGSEIPVV